MEEFPNLHTLKAGGKTIHLVGTAHISHKSAEEVEAVIRHVRPDCVAVELCEARHHTLTRPDAWMEMDLFQVVRQKKATMLLAHLIISAFQRRMGDKLHIRPGAEMIKAMEVAKDTGAQLVLADRDVQVTLKRTWGKLGFWNKIKLASSLLFSVVATPEMTEKEIEELKSLDMLTSVMESFAKAFPTAKKTLIDERDYYLAHHILNAPGKVVVGVVGAGHLAGIKTLVQQGTREDALPPLLAIPPRGWVGRTLKWAVPALVLGLIGYGFASASPQAGWEMIKIWWLAHGLLSAIGAAVAMAHPYTILAAFVAAPFTSLNPMVAAGWVAGLVEALVHKPKVRDFESMAADITTFKGFWRNGVTRILLVVALANIGSTLGTLISLPLMSALV
ncbi:MAG: TraB/GumN family protein [Deltaproteobacteria bacterium]|nr:TraB/GumN family protein [Deltaproteobacteria bacterium]